MVRPITNVISLALDGDNIGEILPLLQQGCQLFAHGDAILPAYDQYLYAATLDLLCKLLYVHRLRVDAIVFSEIELGGGGAVDGQDEEEYFTPFVLLVGFEIIECIGVEREVGDL